MHVFVPPMRFSIEKSVLPQSVYYGFPAHVLDLSFHLDHAMFQMSYGLL